MTHNNKAYEYRYDGRGNLVKRILPGCDVDRYWYDGTDRLTFESVPASTGYGYRFRLYDKFGRLCVQGLCTNCERSFSGVYRAPRVARTQGGGFAGTGYALTPSGLITGAVRIESVAYYDDYSFKTGAASSGFSQLTYTSQGGGTGMLTGAAVAASNGQMLYSVISYDAKGRPVMTESTTLGGGVERTSTVYGYTGKPLTVTYGLKDGGTAFTSVGGTAFTSVTANTYEARTDRLATESLTVTHGGSSVSRRTAAYSYDGLGRVSTVARSGGAGTVSYGYNVRGWLTGITAKAFTEELHYAGAEVNPEPCYNGNVSGMLWTNANYGAVRGYRYAYDGLNRLTSAVYGEGPGLADKANRYDEEVLAYSANGAVERLQRRGRKQNQVYGKIDNLNIELDGNRVIRVEDDALPIVYKGALDFTDDPGDGVEYTYDGEGALTGDKNRGIAKIDYDACGCPRRVQYMDGGVTEYVYSAAGVKLRAVHRTAVPAMSVAFGQTHTLTAAETLSADSTDYLGNLVMTGGKPEMYL